MCWCRVRVRHQTPLQSEVSVLHMWIIVYFFLTLFLFVEKERETQVLWHCDWSMSPMSPNFMSRKWYPYLLYMVRDIVFQLFFLLIGVNPPVPNGRGPRNPEMVYEVSIAWPKIVPPMNQTRVIPNVSSFGGTH